MNKTIITILVVIIAGAGIWFLNFNDKDVIVDQTTMQQTDEWFNINVEYPQFKNIDTGFNESISGLISGKIDMFKEAAKENWKARADTSLPDGNITETPPAPFDFISEWESVTMDKKYISFVLNVFY